MTELLVQCICIVAIIGKFSPLVQCHPKVAGHLSSPMLSNRGTLNFRMDLKILMYIKKVMHEFVLCEYF